jgi:hypothetical protein
MKANFAKYFLAIALAALMANYAAGQAMNNGGMNNSAASPAMPLATKQSTEQRLDNMQSSQPTGASGQNQNANSASAGAPSGLNSDRQEIRQDRQDTRQDLRQDRAELRQDRATVRNDAERWRFARYNNEWWYWTPGNYWMYYRDNNWNRYDAEAFQPYSRYSTGYRGVPPDNNPAIYTDEYGRQYRRDYSPLRRALRAAADALNGGGNIDVNAGPAGANVQVNPGNREMQQTDQNRGSNTGGATSGTGPNVGVEIGGAAGSNR